MAAENDIVDSVPAPQSALVLHPRLFGRTLTVHQLLGGGQIADILLWRKWRYSGFILGLVTFIWVMFEWSGFTILSLLANSALIAVAIVFVWAQAAHFLNRPPPPLPELALSEEIVQWTAQTLRKEVNNALAIAHNVALGKDYILFAKVVGGLYVIAFVGSWFSSLNLFFAGVLLSFTLPVFYEKYEIQVDAHAKKGIDELHKVYAVAEGKTREFVQKVRSHDVFKKKSQ